MKTRTFIKTTIVTLAFSVAMPAFSAGYIKLGDIKGESQRSTTQQAAQIQIMRPSTNETAASMTPEQAEKLRKAIKDAITPKKPCNLNSNTPCN